MSRLLIAACALLAWSCRPDPAAGRAGPANQKPVVAPSGAARSGVALVELFTSEGCSSCPPADALLAHLADRDHVYALSFHVDYWNDLGWRDPWSDPRWSARQRSYSRDGRVYTPQMIVNKVDGFIGSDASAADAAITRALEKPATAGVGLSVRRGTKPGDLVVDWRVTGAVQGAALELAFARRSAEDRVTRGENAGRRLAHVNVVRDLLNEPLDGRRTGRSVAHLQSAAGAPVLPVLIVAWVEAGSEVRGANSAVME